MKNEDSITLADTNIGQKSCVVFVDKYDNKQYNRMLDLGIVKDSKIITLCKSMFSGTVAYLIKGSVIALRKEDANKIKVKLR